MATDLEQLTDGRKHRITARDFHRFRDEYLPVGYQIAYQGEVWDFGIAEGADHVVLFTQQGEAYYAIETPYLNPFQAGSIAGQVRRWIVQWIAIGLENPLIRDANDPPFNSRSFDLCQTDDELLMKIGKGGWPLGQAFHIGNLCFINLIRGGDEWLPIKESTPFKIVSFGRVIASQGMEAAQAELDRLRATPVAPADSPEIRWR